MDELARLGVAGADLIGCFLIGIFYGLFDKGSLMSTELRLFLTVGFCGGFTTFSTFSNDTVNLAIDAELFNLMIYLGVSIIAGISMTILGKNIVQYFWS
jgi:CrcB protein